MFDVTNCTLICVGLLISATSLAEPISEQYSIQKGDDLSSISKTFFGDSTYWPKIWKKTPHLVEPGKSIRMFLGNEDEAPAFAISEADDADEMPMAPLLAAADKKTNLVEIPPTKYPPKPILTRLPPSLPQYQNVTNKPSSFSQFDVDVMPRVKLDPEDRQVLPIFVQESAVKSEGQYLRSALDNHVAMDGDEVFVKMKKGAGQINGHYLLVHDGGALEESPFRHTGNPANAHSIEILGEIILGEIADAKPSTEWDYHRAKMVKALGLSLNESDIVAGSIPTVSMAPTGSPSGASAEIIGGNYDSKGLFFGAGSWVFLNKGSKDGLQINQLLWVNTNLQAHGDDSPIFVGNTKAALVKVVRTEGSVATALVVSSKDLLTQGDTSGSFSRAEKMDVAPDNHDDGVGNVEPLDDSGSGLDTGDSTDDLE
jgi:hypothetical protein